MAAAQATSAGELRQGINIDELAEDAIVWASQHGLVVSLAQAGACPAAVVHAPIAVLPTPFPRASFEKARVAAPLFNKLIDRVAQDDAYLQATLASAAKHDEFTANLLRIHSKMRGLRRDRLVLAMNRSDYMLDEPSGTLMQVELNTIASSFGSLSSRVSSMHRFTMARAGRPREEIEALPANAALEQLADALGEAARAHGCAEGAVLFVVSPGERNLYDQQWLQTALWERWQRRSLRRSLQQLASEAALADDGSLTVGGSPVSVVYYRAGYAPADYKTSGGESGADKWQARELLERSTAAQCPSVAYQLAGAKKVQQDLAAPGVLERFLDRKAEAAQARRCFAGLWSLDDPAEPATAAVIAEAVASPDAFVLKPQREGGGNNLYGPQLARRLQQGGGLSAFILMQRIRPRVQRVLMLREGRALQEDAVSELGVYGTLLRRGEEVLFNREAGHLLRTKAALSDEGGVAAGFAVIDSPLLTD